MDKKRRTLRILLAAAAVILLLGGAYGGYRLVKHEREQAARIAELTRQAETLSGETAELRDMIEALRQKETGGSVRLEENGFNWFAIGNSITLHTPNSHWWNDAGMAATDAEHDYFALVRNALEEKYGAVHAERLYFYAWETRSEDRDLALLLLDPYLDEKLDLVTIQLGENVTDLTTYEQDFGSLIAYIREKAPNARILVTGDFMTAGDREAIKRQACENAGVEYIPLDGIRDSAEYRAGMGTVVFDPEGNAHPIDDESVADHPGDNGMQAIADRITEALDR